MVSREFFKCEKCECIESVDLCGSYEYDNESKCYYWCNRLCSQCDPNILQWHNKFERKSAVGLPIITKTGYLNGNEIHEYFLDKKSPEIISIINTITKITKFNRFDLGLGCRKCKSINFRQGVTKTLSGSTIYPYYCIDCGHKSHICERKEIAIKQYPQVIETAGIEKIQICEVCKSEGTECHHWAPHSVFGNESWEWPTSNLCVKCHLRWHTMMEGYKRTGNKNNK